MHQSLAKRLKRVATMKVLYALSLLIAVAYSAKHVPEQSPEEAAVERYYSQKNGPLDEVCRQNFQDCNQGATRPLQKVQCFIQFGLCTGAKLVGCSKDCIPPLITCKLASIGNWPAAFKCCADFIGCAIGGCSHPGPGYALATTNTVSPIDAAVEVYFSEVSYGMDDTCRMMFGQCNVAARNFGQKLRCLAQLGMCVGAKVVGCSKDCIVPLITCKLAAGADNWPAMFKCAADFIGCSIGGCAAGGSGGSGGPAPGSLFLKTSDDDYTPYEMAIASLYHTTDVKFMATLEECHETHQQCVARAGRNLPRKVQCFIKFGMCIGLQLVGCSAPCLPSLAICKLTSLGNWPAMFICATKFVFCAKSHCVHL